MSLFFNYDRPGPGVDKNAPPQKAVPRFFSILQRKFFDLIKLNLLFCIPVAGAVALFLLLNSVCPYVPVSLLPAILLFPFLGGLTYVTRNYAMEEHAFIFSDFKDAVKNNWKYFLFDGIFCYVVGIILYFSISFYWVNIFKGFFSAIACGIGILLAIILLFSQYYVPVMIVTFDLKFKQILKNSFIFAIIGLWRNLLVTALLGLLAFLLYIALMTPLTIIIALAFAILLLFSYSSFLINFATYPLINKMMIKPYQKQNGESNNGEKK